jgi:hypothetical protein
MNRDRDQFLTEAMGEVWHVVEEGFVEGFGDTFKCSCGLDGYPARMCRKKNKTFSTPDGFFKLWEWCENQTWWFEFWHDKAWIELVRNPDKFADAIYDYIQKDKQ